MRPVNPVITPSCTVGDASENPELYGSGVYNSFYNFCRRKYTDICPLMPRYRLGRMSGKARKYGELLIFEEI